MISSPKRRAAIWSIRLLMTWHGADTLMPSGRAEARLMLLLPLETFVAADRCAG